MKIKIFFRKISEGLTPNGAILPAGDIDRFITLYDTKETLFHEILHWYRQLEKLEKPKTKKEIEDYTEKFTLTFFPILEEENGGEKKIDWES